MAASAQGTAYVSSEKDDALTLIDTQTLTVKGSVPTCKRGRHIQRLPDGKLMVACTDSNAADVIDPATGKSVRRVPLGEQPEAFDVSPDGKTIYVSNEDEAEASFVDAASGKVLKSIKVGQEPEGVKVSADGKTLYVTSEVASMIHVIDVATGTETWLTSLAGTAATNTMRFTATAPAKSPAGGETYTFTPSCLSPTATATVASECATSTFTVSVTVTSLGTAGSVNIASSTLGTLFTGVGLGTYVCGPFPLKSHEQTHTQGDAKIEERLIHGTKGS